MKVKAFLEVLRAYSAALAAHGDVRLASHINALGDVWASAMTWNLKDLISRAVPSDPLPEADEESVQEFRDALVRLQDIVKTVAKQDVVQDLAALVTALEPHDREGLGSFVKACQLALETAQAAKPKRASASNKALEPIDDHRISVLVDQLKQTYKDPDQFGPIFRSIEADTTLSPAELAAIASRFAYDTPPRTKKAESLRRIWLVHESYATSAAKSKFSGGRSAA